MLEREQRSPGVERADVVRRAHLVDRAIQRRPARQVAEAHAGQAELAQRAHHQHVRPSCAAAASTCARRTAGRPRRARPARAPTRDDALDRACVEQVGGRVVRIGDVDERRAVLARSPPASPRRRARSPRVSGTPTKLQPLQLRRHLVHRRSRATAPGSSRPGTSQAMDEQRDQLVGAVAEHQLAARRQAASACRAARLQAARIRRRVAVERHRPRRSPSSRCSASGRPNGFSIASSLIKPGCARHRIGVHRAHVVARHRAIRPRPMRASSLTSEAAGHRPHAARPRACASRPSPRASVGGDRPEPARAGRATPRSGCVRLLEVVDAERRREARGAAVGSTWFGPAQ